MLSCQSNQFVHTLASVRVSLSRPKRFICIALHITRLSTMRVLAVSDTISKNGCTPKRLVSYYTRISIICCVVCADDQRSLFLHLLRQVPSKCDGGNLWKLKQTCLGLQIPFERRGNENPAD